jgi:Concanavalin A-like lectin/glucanases superfamily
VYPGLGSDYVPSPDVGNSIWDGTWHHIAGTFDGSTVRLYVDGTQVGTDTTPESKTVIAYNLPFQDFYIATYYGSCQFGFVGDISEVHIWNCALSSNEVLLRAQGAEENP